MAATRLRTVIGRWAAGVAVAAALIVIGSAVDRLRAQARYYDQRAQGCRASELSAIQNRQCMEAMEANALRAAAKFRRGEWGLDDAESLAKFEQLLRTVKETRSDALVKTVCSRYFESMAKTNEESAASCRELAESAARRAEYFGRMRQKYERAAARPWWPVPPDPPEPK